MEILRTAAARGDTRTDWLDSRHAFSFGQYHDREWMGFGPLRVFNEDRVEPGAGFPLHGHANMEILSYVLSGALAHRDDSGSDGGGSDGGDGQGVLHAGQMQWMSAGHGINHSEFNASQVEPVHFLQVWIQPDRVNAPPAHAQRAFDPAARRGRWATLVSPDGGDGSLPIRQQAWVRGVQLGEGESVVAPLRQQRRYWLHVAQGTLAVGGRTLEAGDALGVWAQAGELALTGSGGQLADVLMFDLPG